MTCCRSTSCRHGGRPADESDDLGDEGRPGLSFEREEYVKFEDESGIGWEDG